MRVFLDADVLFDAVHDMRAGTLLRRIKNAGHELVIPVSVLGEVMLVCISEERQDDLLSIWNICSELEVDFAVSSERSKICNLCIEKYDQRAFNLADKDHLAHAVAHISLFGDAKDSYFLTTDLYLLDFRLPCRYLKDNCGLFGSKTPLKIVNLEEMRLLL
jgi:predicted nucleic acid-binding protein